MKKTFKFKILMIISSFCFAFLIGLFVHSDNFETVYASDPTYTIWCNNKGTVKWQGTTPTTVTSGQTIYMNSQYENFTINLYLDGDGNAKASADYGNAKTYTVEKECKVSVETTNTYCHVKLTSIYSVEYNYNGGSGSTSPTSKLSVGENIDLDTGSNLSRNNYSFKGWSLSSTAETGIVGNYTIKSDDIINNKITFYAVWECNGYFITYDSNGATIGEVPTDSTIYAKNASITVSGNTGNLDKTGYIFDGWNTDSDYKYGNDYAVGSTYTMGESNVTLYAKWVPAYTISYNINGGTGTAPTDTNKYKNETQVTLASTNGLTKTGYHIVGWSYTDQATFNDCISSPYILWDTDAFEGVVTFYAVWESDEYCATHHKQMSYVLTGSNNSQHILFCDTCSIQYGTAEAHDSNGEFDSCSKCGCHSITYVLDGGTNGNNANYYLSNSVTTFVNATKIGYVFDGWYTDSEFKSSDKITATDEYCCTDLTLYAKFELCTDHSFDSATHKCIKCSIQGYSISFDDSVIDDSVTNMPTDNNFYTQGSLVNIPVTKPVRKGYKFLGWSTTLNATAPETFTNNQYTIGGSDAILYAVWEEKLTITVNQDIQYFNVETAASDIVFNVTGTNIPISGLNISYRACTFNPGNFESNLFTTNKVSQSYDIKITREEDDAYKALDLTINKGIKLYISIIYYDSDKTSGTVPTDDAKYVYYDMSPRRTQVLGNTGSLSRTGYTFDGWYYIYTNTTDASNLSKVDINTESKYINIKDKYNIHVYPNWKLNVNDITKDNDYEVTSSADLSNVTYSWCINNVYKLEDLTNGNIKSGADYSADISMLVGLCSELDLPFNLKYYDEGCYVRFKTVNGYIYYSGTDGEYLTLTPTKDDDYFQFKFENIDGEPDTIYDIELVLNKNISGENKAKLGNAAKGHKVYCIVSYQQIVHGITLNKTVKTNAVEVKEVKFDGNGATSGSMNNLYYLSGRSVSLNQNSYTRTGYKFLGWNTDKNATTKLSTLSMADSDITLYAIWTDKYVVAIDESVQSNPYNGSSQSFILKGDNKDIGSFTIEYYVDDAWTETAPIVAGEYNVKIARAEDDNYKAYSKEITKGLTITSVTVKIVLSSSDNIEITYGGSITEPTATLSKPEFANDITLTKGYYKVIDLDSEQFSKVDSIVNVGSYAIIYTTSTTNTSIKSSDAALVLVTVNKAKVNEPTVVGTYKYNGQQQTVSLTGVESFMSTTDSLSATNVGDYTIAYTLDDNHEWNAGNDGIISWSIKAISITPTVKDGEEVPTKQNVVVETDEGFESNIEVTVEVTVETEVLTSISNNTLSVDYYNLSNVSVKLEKNESVGVVFDVKLIQTVNSVSTEIQPKDIKEGTIIKVKMLIPNNIDISKVTRILHVHSASDIEEIAFDASKVDTDGYYEISIDRLSEFAFIYKNKPQASVLAIILFILLGLLLIFVGMFFIWKIEYDKAKKEYRLEDRKLEFLDIIYVPINELLTKLIYTK